MTAVPPDASTEPAPAFQLPLAPGRPLEKQSATGDAVPAFALPLDPADTACALWLEAGESVLSPLLWPDAETVLEAEALAAGGASLQLFVEGQRAGSEAWALLAVLALGADLPRARLQLGLAQFAGAGWRFRLRRDEAAGTAAVTLWRICPQHARGRVNAYADYAYRLDNEIRHFSGAAYNHAMYGAAPAGASGEGEVAAAVTQRRDPRAEFESRVAQALQRLEGLAPDPGEASYHYAHRTLAALLPTAAPDFGGRVRGPGAGRIRALSILAGAARLEERMLRETPLAVDLTLMDASRDLVQRAADRLAAAGERHRVRCLVGDINTGLPTEGEAYDVILCISALHHVVDLEMVLGEVNRCLAPDGQFWSIGEQVGRNGNRLWPEARAIANEVFSAMPERLRMNAYSKQADPVLTDKDFSQACLEGIRSEELPALLDAYLVPEHVDLRNAFLWRIVDATYCDNFRLDVAEDLHHLRRCIAFEAAHWACGGRGTELNGIYRKKYLR